jgi:hypothetical protein
MTHVVDANNARGWKKRTPRFRQRWKNGGVYGNQITDHGIPVRFAAYPMMIAVAI